MQALLSYFGRPQDPKKPATRSALIRLRLYLQVLEKKKEHLTNAIEEEMRKAMENSVTNKAGTSVSISVSALCVGER
jgi:hypothetical protein